MNAVKVAALLVSAFGVVAGLAVLAASRRLRLSLSVALELWTAAGLLRLSAEATWQALAGAAVIIVVRKVVASGLD